MRLAVRPPRAAHVATHDGRREGRPERSHEEHLLEDLLAELRRVGADLPIWFGDEVERAELERLEDVLLLRVRAHHDHRRRLLGHQDAKERESVHPRHLEVERDDVGLQERRQAKRFLSIGGLADHLHVGAGGEHIGDVPAVVRRVIDDHETYRRGRVVLTDGFEGVPRMRASLRLRLAGVPQHGAEGLLVNEVFLQM